MKCTFWCLTAILILASPLQAIPDAKDGVQVNNIPASLDSVLGAGADKTWKMEAGGYSIANLAELPFSISRTAANGSGHPVLRPSEGANLVLDGQTRQASGVEVTAWVRLKRQGSSVCLQLARNPLAPNPASPGKSAETFLSLTCTASPDQGQIQCVAGTETGSLHDIKALAAKSDWPEVQKPFECNYFPRAYTSFPPYWSGERRTRIENDMMSLPSSEERWYCIRVELGQGFARFWLDDRLVAEKRETGLCTDGTLRLTLSPGTELASLVVRPSEVTPGFLPIRIGGYLNGRAFGNLPGVDSASLPAPDRIATLDGIPFIFPGSRYGSDHLDISRSFFREANEKDYDQGAMYVWPGSWTRDPARIQIRVPNGQYDSLYIVAAADDSPERVPLITAMFFRPGAGFAENFSARVPLATTRSAPDDARPLPVSMANGSKANLWMIRIPLDPGRLSSFGDMDFVEIEFTKEVRIFQSYPSPEYCGWHQAGQASAVHLYAVTLAETPVGFSWEPDLFGHVWQAPAQVSYTATLTNRTAAEQKGTLTVIARSYDSTDEYKQEFPVTLPALTPGMAPVPIRIKTTIPAKLYGYYDLTATLAVAGRTWTEKRSFVRLAPDTRSIAWTGKGAMFGYWSYMGGHHGPYAWHIAQLMAMAGARKFIGESAITMAPPEVQTYLRERQTRASANAWEVQAPEWMADETLDPAKVAEYQKKVIANLKGVRDPIPPEYRPDHVYFYAEPGLSDRLTGGNIPEYWGEKPYVLTAVEQRHLRAALNSSRIASEAIRREWPELKILIPWGDPGFTWPLLRAGLQKTLIDGSGVDTPGFQHLPERQLHEQGIHRLYTFRKEFEKAGIPNPDLRYCEGIFVPTEPGACTWREQMDLYSRWTLLSMAYGVRHFYSGWFGFDSGNYYGAEFYGGCGIQRRVPYCDPKPAYAAYATMTDKLNEASFDGWLPTGSLSTYALRFKHDTRGFIYALWTLRGKRPVTLELSGDTIAHVTDSMNNTREIKSSDRKLTFSTDTSVHYVSFPSATLKITGVNVGEPDHGDAAQATGATQVADLGDGTWSFSNERDAILEGNSFAVMHYPGRFMATCVDDPGQGRVLLSRLEKQDKVHELMPWYNVLRPAKPVVLNGAPSRLGLWVRGASDWGRIIYILRDAKGERWTSIGAKNTYNTDDPGAQSQFCFDGWRYLTFQLPGHTGWDSYRKHGTAWWRGGDAAPGIDVTSIGSGVVNLPLTLEAIIVEQRTHALYVNDIQPCRENEVALGKLFTEYDSPKDCTDEAVRISRLRMPPPPEAPTDLPNTIAKLEREGVGAPARIVRLTPPLHMYNGRRMHVHFEGAPATAVCQIWVSTHSDGRGAMNMTPSGIKSGDLMTGLWPGCKLFYWITYMDDKGQCSKPSPVYEAITVDTFTGSADDTGHVPCGCPAHPFEHY